MGKPKLIPVSVPWMIETGAPHLTLQSDDDGAPVSATFIAYFRCDDVPVQPNTGLRLVERPTEFVPTPLELKSAYRLVQVNFIRSKVGRVGNSYSDLEVIKKSDFDWSEVPGRLSNEKIEQYVNRMVGLWLKTKIAPHPNMFEVSGSSWLSELGLQDSGLHHYMLLGHDNYAEVIAASWNWEAGQAS